MTAPLSVVYGGGGFYGIAYGLGVAHGLRDGGIDLTGVRALGTSAGSWVASAMVHGVGFAEFDALDAPSLPDRRPGLLEGLAASLFGDDVHANVSAVVVHTRDGRRRILRGDKHRLADLCAASSAVPGVYAPHRVNGRSYVDGGVRSPASVDVGPPADHMIAIIPLGGPIFGVGGRGLDVLLRREAGVWRQRNPASELTIIRPNAAIAGQVGYSPRNLFDAERAKAVYPLAVEQGARWAERIQTNTATEAA